MTLLLTGPAEAGRYENVMQDTTVPIGMATSNVRPTLVPKNPGGAPRTGRCHGGHHEETKLAKIAKKKLMMEFLVGSPPSAPSWSSRASPLRDGPVQRRDEPQSDAAGR